MISHQTSPKTIRTSSVTPLQKESSDPLPKGVKNSQKKRNFIIPQPQIKQAPIFFIFLSCFERIQKQLVAARKFFSPSYLDLTLKDLTVLMYILLEFRNTLSEAFQVFIPLLSFWFIDIFEAQLCKVSRSSVSFSA